MTSRFWILEAPDAQPRAKTVGAKYEPIICSANPGHRSAGKRLGDLSVIVHPLGVKDFTWIWGGKVLISRRALNLFDKYRVTGFETRPVGVSYPKDIHTPPAELFELIVTGWAGLAAPGAGVRLEEWCPVCRYGRHPSAREGLGIRHHSCAENFREKWSRSESRLSGVVHAGAARARA